MRWMTQYMGALTHARLDRAVVARYFAFLVISQLIIFTLIGVVFSKFVDRRCTSTLIIGRSRLCLSNGCSHWKACQQTEDPQQSAQ